MSESEGSEFEYRRLIHFSDTDMAGIAHFSVFFQIMEEAEHAFLRDRSIRIFEPYQGGHISWPRVSVHCDFHSPAVFEDEISVHVHIDRLGDKSITYRIEMLVDDRKIATGKTTAVCCFVTDRQLDGSVSIPDSIRSKLESKSKS